MTKFTKKHYEFLAQIISDCYKEAELHQMNRMGKIYGIDMVRVKLARTLLKSNPKFKTHKFFELSKLI